MSCCEKHLMLWMWNSGVWNQDRFDFGCRIYFQAKITASDFTLPTAVRRINGRARLLQSQLQQKRTSRYLAAPGCPLLGEGTASSQRMAAKWSCSLCSVLRTTWKAEEVTLHQTWISKVKSDRLKQNLTVIYNKNKWGAAQWECLNMHLGLNLIKTHHEQDASLHDCMCNSGCSQKAGDQTDNFH